MHQANKIQKNIISWYVKNKRDLPWRETTNPYFIWLSEILLQQTRVSQGLPFYIKFTENFPKIEDLANASEEKVLRLWQGLGYYSRGRNLHFTAKIIVNDFQGVFPKSYKEILKLKGVGHYTAAAIASFAFKEKVAAVDGNVIRVISRLYKIDQPVDSTQTLKQINEIAQELISEKHPDLFNQAMMELGAMVCTPKSPKCTECPIQEVCLSYPDKAYEKIPFKAKKTKVLERNIYYLVLKNEDSILLNHRADGDIWKNMYDFPEIEKPEIPDLLSSFSLENIKISEPITHLLSHRKLNIQFISAEINTQKIPISGIWTELHNTDKLPKPKVIVDFLETYKKKYPLDFKA